MEKDYIHRGGAHLAAEVADVPFSDPGRIEHFFVDHLGSIGATTNKLGHIADSHRYHAFGQEPPDSGQFKPEAMRFTGHERDQNQGNNTVDDLDYMHARYYAPHIGRFLSIDPGADHALETPQSWNYYAYARNNPVNNTDPDGRFVAFITDVALQLAFYAGGFPDSFYDSTARAYTTGRRATADLMQGRAILDRMASSLTSQLAGTDISIRAATSFESFLIDIRSGSCADCVESGGFKIGMIPIGPGAGLNKLHHIFGKEAHNLGSLIQRFGSQGATFQAVRSATQAAVKSQGLTGVFETTVNVSGQHVVVRGKVIEGVARIGTFFIP